MRPLFHLFTILKRFSGEIILSILLGIATIGAAIGLLGTSSWLIASAALQPSIAELQIAIVGVRFFGISRGIFRYLERLVSHSVNLRVVSALREDFYRRVEPGAPVNLHLFRSGDLLDRVMSDLATIENFYVRLIAPVIVAVVITIGVSLFIGGYLVECGVILASGMVTNGFILPGLLLIFSRPWIKKLTHARTEISASVVENLQGLEDLQSYNAQNLWFEKLHNEINKSGHYQEKLTLFNAFSSGLSLLVLNLTLLALLWVAIPFVDSGDISGISLAVLVIVASASFEATATLPAAALNFNASLEAAGRLFSIGLPRVREQNISNPSKEPAKKLTVEHLNFSYDDTAHPTLQDINFELLQGEKKAIVGVSGSGKTSILNLFLRFQDPSAGKVLIDQIDLAKIDQTNLSQIFGMIPQNPYIFTTSLRENLKLANPEASDSELTHALLLAELGDWVEKLPDGLDTWVGEHGIRMSAGERQRLAVARVLLQDAPIILLDEPTANLDPVNETRILRNLFELYRNKGILLVTHRLRFLEEMDEILVLEGSTIAERGNYQELIQMGGIFTRLVELDQDSLSEDTITKIK